MGRRSTIRLAVGVFVIFALAEATNPAFAQNLNDLLRIFGGDNQRATRQARAEWRRLPPAETSCIDQRLRHKGSSVEALIRGGVKPSATRLVQLRSSCREFVQGVQVDSAPASAQDAAGSPTPALSPGKATEPRDANVTSLAETPQGSGMASTAESSSDSDVPSSAESPKDSSATLPSQESVAQVAEEQVQRSDLESENSLPERETIGWLSAALLFASVALASLLGLVIYLFVRWRNTQRTVAVSLPEKNSDGAGSIRSEMTLGKADEVVPPLAHNKIQQPDKTGKSGATSRKAAQSSASQPTYGELFPEIVSSEASEPNVPGSKLLKTWPSLQNFVLRRTSF
jgi:hypothetical protein